MKLTKSYLQNHPRPDATRKEWEDLNGLWKFRFDPHNSGLSEGWQKGFSSDLEILVPYAYQSPKSGINEHESCNVVWYEKKVVLQSLKNKRPILHLEGSDYFTDIYINGQHMTHNEGGYHQVSVDLSVVLDKEITIVIRVEDALDATYPRGKQRWKTPSYECFYIETTGLYKPVWIEYVGTTFLSSFKMTPDITKRALDISYLIDGNIDNVSIETIITYDETLISQSTQRVTRNIFSLSHPLTTDLQTMKLHLWQPNSPNLYDISFNLIKDGEIIDTLNSYFGARKFDIIGPQILLNHVPIYMKMILDQGYFNDGHMTPTEEDIIKDILLMKSLGFNGVRKHEKIEDARFHYYCDVLGLLSWVEMPSFYEFNDIAAKRMLDEWQMIVKSHYNFPSVMAWVCLNESWGVPGIIDDKHQQAFADAMVHATKSIDQTRIVISNDGWEHTHSDVITLHNYRETYDELYQSYNDITKVLNRKAEYKFLPKFPLANGYEYKQQPIIISEFAGIAFEKDTDSGWGYGKNVQNESEFLNKLESQVNALLDIPQLSGYCITQLTDVQQEVNGLYTEDRKLKVDLSKLKKIIEKNPK
jgi:beta-galactosidase/beta-glucuronidase